MQPSPEGAAGEDGNLAPAFPAAPQPVTAYSPQAGGDYHSPVCGTLVDHAPGVEVASRVAEAVPPSPIIARIDSRIRRKAERVVQGLGDAYYIDDTGKALEGVPADQQGRPLGWSAARQQLAKDARRTLKTQPGYISQQIRIYETLKRVESEKPAAPTLNVVVISPDATLNFGPPLKVER